MSSLICIFILIFHQMKSFIAKRFKSILVNLRYLRFKLLKYREYNKKICDILDHNVRCIMYNELGIIRKALFCIILYGSALTLKMSKMALNPFCDLTFQIVFVILRSKKFYYLLIPVHFASSLHHSVQKCIPIY